MPTKPEVLTFAMEVLLQSNAAVLRLTDVMVKRRDKERYFVSYNFSSSGTTFYFTLADRPGGLRNGTLECCKSRLREFESLVGPTFELF